MSDVSEARLLILGFGPFPGVLDNPAAQIVQRLAASGWTAPDTETTYREIPVSWTGAYPAALAAMEETRPNGVLVLGVAGGAEWFRVEMRATNQAAIDRADADGERAPQSRISNLGPGAARASAPIAPMVAALKAAGLSAQASSDAGDYLCNQIFYRLLTELDRGGDGAPVRVAFLHLPPADALGLEALERGVKVAAETFARHLVFTTAAA